MKEQVGRPDEASGWEVIGSFATYADAQRAAEEMAAAEEVPQVAMAIWPAGWRMVGDGAARAANDAVIHWIASGALLGGLLGTGFGAVNAVSSVIPRPWSVFAILVVVGVTIGTLGGVMGGAIAARRVSREVNADPLFRAHRYQLVVDCDRARRHRPPWKRASGGEIDLRDRSDHPSDRR